MEDYNSNADYQEMEKLFPARVKEMRTILQDKNKLIIPKQCDEFLVRCLRLKDGNVEKAIKLIKAFHAAVADFNNWDATLQPSLHQDFYDLGPVTPMIHRDSLGRRIFVIRTETWDPSKTNFDEAIACLWMMAQHANAEYPDVQRQGFVSIWDFSNFSLQQAWAVKQWRLISLAKWIQNGVSGRIKAFHAINHPKVVSILYSGLKPFLKEKLRKRIIFHDNLESLVKHVNAPKLPEKLGGSLPFDECIDKPMVKDLLHNDKFFQDMINNRLPLK